MELWQIVKDNITQEENFVITARFQRADSRADRGADREVQGHGETDRRQGTEEAQQSRVIWQLEERFEINYSRGYRGSLTNFRYTHTSIVESIAIMNEEVRREYGGV